jgi:hypothetical protein
MPDGYRRERDANQYELDADHGHDEGACQHRCQGELEPDTLVGVGEFRAGVDVAQLKQDDEDRQDGTDRQAPYGEAPDVP